MERMRMQDLVILCRASCAVLSTTPQLPNPGIPWIARCTDGEYQKAIPTFKDKKNKKKKTKTKKSERNSNIK
jgi:hypothetical protein